MSKENEKKENCPLSRMCSELDRIFGNQSDFRSHLNRSRIEFLKAMRFLIDSRIDNLEDRTKSKARGTGKTSIEVE